MRNKKQKTKNKIIFGMIFAIMISFISYSYAIASTTLSASQMEIKNDKIAEIETEIAELETEYFEIINSLAIEKPEDYNLISAVNIAYVDVNNDVRVAYNY